MRSLTAGQLALAFGLPFPDQVQDEIALNQQLEQELAEEEYVEEEELVATPFVCSSAN